jgi:hypothetical protein
MLLKQQRPAMRALLIILIALTACCAGLLIILSVSYFNYETPSMADAIGFGGLLLFAGLFLIPICYLPTIHFLRKIRPKISRPGITAGLIALGNAPVYIFLWMTRRQMGYGEDVLFFIGFIAIALVFGMAYPLEKKILQK